MKNYYWILPLLNLVASPIYATTVDTIRDTGYDPIPFQGDDSADSHADNIYNNTQKVDWKTYFTDTFVIEKAGVYHVYLDDFENSKPLIDFGAEVTAGKGYYFGFQRGEGSFTFEATPGEYDISIWAKADYETRMGEFNVRIAAWDTSAVPVPAAVWLFGSGLLGLISISRRKTV